MVTQYNTVDVGNYEKEIIDFLISNRVVDEQDLINKFGEFDKDTIREFIYHLEALEAVEIY